LPPPCPALNTLPVAKSPLYCDKLAQAAFALNAPGFGWHYVKFWLDARLELPSRINQRSIMPMYLHVSRNMLKDRTAQTLELRDPNNAFVSTVLEAYVLCRDLQIPHIAERVSIPADVVQMYYDLFFNVRGRFDEPLYAARIVYPATKLADFQEDGFDPKNIRQNLFRLAHEYGSEALEYELGTRLRTFSPALTEKMANGLEGRIMVNARTVAGWAGLTVRRCLGRFALALVCCKQGAKVARRPVRWATMWPVWGPSELTGRR
jgi:hypothetical protein